MQLAERISTGLPYPIAAPDGDERIARLRLARSRNVGPRTWLHLMRRFGTARRALEALPALAARGGANDYVPCEDAAVEAELAAGEAAAAHLLALGDAEYPALLAAIENPPPVVWVKGDPAIFRRPAVAIVGARNASALGTRLARRLARELGESGLVIVSGLARGIDAAAHGAALPTGTVAVLAGGLDRIYPEENEPLAAEIAESGALVSECPMGVEPTSRHFPKRNRLISGAARGVVLIEAAHRSGSLITARYALEQGREAMACPGAPDDPRSAGCNALIRDGAALIRSAEDAIEALGPLAGPVGFADEGTEFTFDSFGFGEEEAGIEGFADLDPDGHEEDAALAGQVIALLGHTPVDIDEIARTLGSRPGDLSLVLIELDLAGRIDILPGNRVAIAA